MKEKNLTSVTRTANLPKAMVEALDKGQRSTRVIELALETYEQGYALSLIPSRGKVPLKVNVPAALAKYLGELKAQPGNDKDSEGSLLARLAYTAWQKSGQAKPDTKHSDTVNDTARAIDLPNPGEDRSYYPAQREFITRLVQASTLGRVIGLESATGTGKGLLIAAAAYVLASRGQVVAIASPSHRISDQTRIEIDKLTAGDDNAPGVAVIRGRQEYVSRQRLVEYVEYDTKLTDQDRADLKQWMGEQGTGAEDWLLDELPDTKAPVDTRGIALRPDDGGQGEEAYKAQFVRAEKAKILLCTHIMLANDFMMRLGATSQNKVPIKASTRGREWDAQLMADARSRFGRDPEKDRGVIPRYTVLIVDEAHQLESMYARARSRDASIAGLRNLMRAARDNGVPGLNYALDRIDKAWSHMRELGQALEGERLNLHNHPQAREVIAEMIDYADKAAAATLKKAKKSDEIREISRLLSQDVATMKSAMNRLSGDLSWVSFSPVRYYPRIETGPASVSALLARTWARVGVLSGGAVLSATLYLPRQNGVPTPDPMLLLRLAIPRAVLEPEPAPGANRHVPEWVFNPVTLHRVAVRAGGSRHHPLTPPSESQESAPMAQWSQSLAQPLVNEVLPNAQGGTLILNTSFFAIEMLAQALEATDPSLKARLIASDGQTPFELERKRYMRMAYEGQRPIWLATGRAWTGLDLSMQDRPAEQDMALTDLVIPRLPFNLNRTITHRFRTSGGNGFMLSEQEMLLMLRQGAGRLVRRKGIHNRHLWLFDARAFDAAKKYHKGVGAICLEYRHRKPILLDAFERSGTG